MTKMAAGGWEIGIVDEQVEGEQEWMVVSVIEVEDGVVGVNFWV